MRAGTSTPVINKFRVAGHEKTAKHYFALDF